MSDIEGVYFGVYFESPALEGFSLRAGKPDVDEAVGVTMELFHELGARMPDTDAVSDNLCHNFTSLAELGYDGRLYSELPKEVSLDRIISAADRNRAKGVETAYRYPNLWTPGFEPNSYTAEELDGSLEGAPQARLAIFNADRNTGVDPLLHGLMMPYDDRHRGDAPQTQLEALEATSQEFANRHPAGVIEALGHRAAVTMVLMDRVRGVTKVNPNSAQFALNQGFLRMSELGRHAVGGGSVVGYVDSIGSQLRLDWSHGVAYPHRGVGVSAGLHKLNIQAS